MCPMVTAFPVPLLPSKASCRTSCMCNAIIASMYCNMLRAASLDTRVARHIIETVLCCLFCAAAIGASTEVISANLYVTDSPVSSAYGKNVTAGDRLVANFALRDIKTNATIGASLGYCVLLRDAGPNQCLYTIQFASGTIQVSGLTYATSSAGFDSLTNGVLAITGGTGLYTGATGFYKETSFNPDLSAGSGPSGVVINIYHD